ncbi:MutS-related protein [Pseudobacter ginsenosidimutans]|uniref:MutS-like protein n=1 Tax=Pseudobacter ginsenosidimutans TaxID=661488 RepID=A0A4Q7MR42_9BACT|nr:DNA mismatch repair protein [Pseudobacter ginsenosidimutans]QEC45753.1 DNA mismatch repair protein [Pseudobacter ginsenosidimutans]RZS69302.1 MutS-like protein [Pseudobacter ginsenosidimutans]
MSFIIDKQTLDDLNIFGKQRSSIYNIFNNTHTRGGALLLEDMFNYPLADAFRIRQRTSIIRFFRELDRSFPFSNESFDIIEHYLENTDERSKLTMEEDNLQRKLKNIVGADTEFEALHKAVLAVMDMCNRLQDFLNGITGPIAEAWQPEVTAMQQLLKEPLLQFMREEKKSKKLNYAKVAEYDRLLRFVSREKIKKLLYHVYSMDVYMSVANVSKLRGFAFAETLDGRENMIEIEGMYHPGLSNPVSNQLRIDRSRNLIFLTGANMAGKSTFMKTLGITIFLAHMGFPVPARQMKFSVQQGLFTTINLSDNLNMGYSHFYAEVLRLKKVAEQAGKTERLVIIFDELFRGTNVKDAFDATVTVADAFAEKRDCTFILSTHIIEAGEVLKEKCDNINFVYFPTIMKEQMPEYTYRLTQGITNDRHGMMIIGNENIIGILKSRKQNAKTGVI